VAELLLEIGCEEIPAGWLPGLGEQLRRRFENLAARVELPAEATTSSWTPRRLVLSADLPERQADRESVVWGPSLRVARDAEGRWTKAALGFARKNGVEPEALEQAPKNPSAPDELHLRFVAKVTGRDAIDVLPGLLSCLLRSLSFPKRMSWDAWLDDGKGAFPFGRPIRWIVALLDGRVVPFTIYALEHAERGRVLVTSGNATRGHRFLPRGPSGGTVPVASAEDLRQRLRDGFVLLDPEERTRRIREGLASGGDAELSAHPLAEEWRDLVEYPSVVFGEIPGEFQELPVEVLETVLVHHQKYIPVGSSGRVSRFAAVTNTDGASAGEIARGMERVVVARLRDAAFFFEEDVKRPLAERVADLEGVTFHQLLGSYRAKADRMQRLVEQMGGELGLLTTAERDAAREAALLAKADLTTLMVREFPELQGVMGGLYLEAQGHPRAAVAAAVRWHYHPLSIEPSAAPAGMLSGSTASVFGAVSIADKLDTLAGYFGIGEEPTGSRDPYGLRRAGQGVIRVLLDFWHAGPGAARPNLTDLIDRAISGYETGLKVEGPLLQTRLELFLMDRLEHVLASRGFPADEVAAVLQTERSVRYALDDPFDCLVRLQALNRVRSEAREDFEHLAVAFKRAKNILGKGTPSAIRPELLHEAAERELDAAVGRLEQVDGDYEVRLRSLAGLRAPVDRFFDDVLVMAEEPELRSNRLGLLARALSLFYRIADISKLGG